MNRTRHIGWKEILDHVESGRPSGPQASHLRRCHSCRRLENEAAALLGALPIAGLPLPSEDLIQETWRRMRATSSVDSAMEADHATSPTLRDRLREIWAVLIPRPLVPAQAVRGIATPQLLMYETDDYAISLSISEGSAPATREILGKVIPRIAPRLPSGARVILRRLEREEKGELTEFGGFRFADVPAGEIRLSIEVAGLLIHLPPLS